MKGVLKCMSNEKMFKFDEAAAELNISRYTLRVWYTWENKLLKEGSITERYLPEGHIATNERGTPRYFTKKDIEQLRKHKNGIIVGRNGIYGKFSNPNHKEKEAK